MGFHDRLRAAITLLDSHRAELGDDVVELALAPLHECLVRETGNAPAQRLRQASVLFCDVTGSTTLMQKLTPEEAHLVMDRALSAFSRLVHAHGGTVLQYAGDSMMAAWGVAGGGEQDAPSAVRAGLAILREGAEIAEEVRLRHGHEGFGVRAGVASGQVLAGSGVEGERSLRGVTVYVAARMEQTAPPGRLRVCPDTWRMTRGLFEGEPQPLLQVKGIDQPMATWLVRDAAADAPAQALRGIEGLHTPCIGRAAELDTLRRAWAGPGLRAVWVSADAGVGKTRLAHELAAALSADRPGLCVLSAQADERGAQRPYAMLRQWLGRPARLRESDDPEAARRAWLETAAPLLGSQGDAAVLGQLIGLCFDDHPEVRSLGGDARLLRDRSFFHASHLLRALAGRHGDLLVVLDDLQWGDAGTLAFVDHLLRHEPGLPLMLLALARPAPDDQPSRPGPAPAWQRLDLAPLAPESTQALVHALLQRLPDAGASWAPWLVETSAGNPFFLEELVQVLLERGGRADAGPRSLPLPHTLHGVLQARLDGLPAAAARLLQSAAIVGPVFWDDALAAMDVDTAGLATLQARGFIVEQARSRFEGRREFAFRHHLMHRACDQRVLRADRVAGHLRVAGWLERLPGSVPPELLAEHLERGEEPRRAAAAWRRAALQAQARYANEQALAMAGRALALAGGADLALRFELTQLRAQVLELTGDTIACEAELDTLERLAGTLHDPLYCAEALDARTRFLHKTGQAAEALEMAERTRAAAPPTAPHLVASASRYAAHALRHLGRHAEFQRRAEEALSFARRTGNLTIEGAMLNALGVHADDQGDPAAAMAFYERALACHRSSGNQAHEADVLSNLGYVELGLGAYEDAGARFEEVLARVRRIGQREREAAAMLNLALVALHTGVAGRAMSLAGHAEELLGAVRSRSLAAAARRIAGQACLAADLADEAVRRLQAACDEFEGLGMAGLAMEARASLARARWAAGDAAGAESDLRQVLGALEGGTSIVGTEEPLRVLADVVQLLQALGDPRAERWRADARALLHERASRIGDEARRAGFLHRVPHHRALLEPDVSVVQQLGVEQAEVPRV